MTTQLQSRCDALLQSYHEISGESFWSSGRIMLAAAGLYLATGKPLNIERIRECREMLRSRTGFLSDFRQSGEYIICCKLAMQSDPEMYFDRLADLYKKVLPGKFGDERGILAAMLLADQGTNAEREAGIAKTKAIYEKMRRAHKALTSGEDLPFAAVMALSAWSADEVFDRAEDAFRLLKKQFRAEQNARQALSHNLSVCDGSIEALCEKACRLYAPLRSVLGTGIYAASLGTLAGFEADADELAAQVREADEYLKQFDPFKGFFGINRRDRCLYAVLCTESAAADSEAAFRSAILSAVMQLTVIRYEQMVMTTNMLLYDS